MAKYYQDLAAYITDIYYNQLFRSVNNYIWESDLDFSTNLIPDVNFKKLQDVFVSSLYTEMAENDYHILKCNVRADIEVKGYIYGRRKREYCEDKKSIWFAVDIKTRFRETFSNMRIINICPIQDKDSFKSRGSTTKSFIPYMKEEDLDYYATKFLEKHYPEALLTPTRLNMCTLLNRMGLTAKQSRRDTDVFGKIYFKDKLSNDGTKVIERGTIVYHPNTSFYEDVGEKRNTVVHECVHWEYHKCYFDLQHLLNPEYTAIACTKLSVDMQNPSLNTNEFRWMEYQANALAPRILMPAQMAKLKYTELYQKFNTSESLSRCEVIKNTVVAFAEFFGVSLTSAKIRLFELGYNQVIGVLGYISPTGNKTYYSSKDICKNETYSATINEALLAQFTHPKLKAAVNDGLILFVNGFYVLNNKKYVYRDSITKRFELTSYALEHIDECCLLFDVTIDVPSTFNTKFYSLCFLCKTKHDTSVSKRDFDAEKEHNQLIFNKLMCPEFIAQDLAEAIEYVRNLPFDFNQAFRQIYDDNYVPFNTFSKECGLDIKTIESYYDGDNRPRKKNALAIISAFDIHPRVAHHLLATLSYNIQTSPLEEDALYCHLIQILRGEGYNRWNRFMLDAGVSSYRNYLIPERVNISKYL